MFRISSPYASVALWVAWATFGWALVSWFVIFPAHIRWPGLIYLAALLSGGIALIGGIIGFAYVVLAARTKLRVLSGVAAILANLVYYWVYLDEIFHNPP